MVVYFLAIFLASCSRQPPKVETVTINNVNPRCDVNGQILDAHGGCLQYFGDRFYLYGNHFGTNKDETKPNCPLVAYSSSNLMEWTYEGSLLRDPPGGVYYRPYVVFNPHTKKYVLWYNWYQKLWHGQAGVAVSDNPAGPFVITNLKAHLSGSCPGDGSLFVDDDGTGYYIYTDIANNYALRIEQLKPDYFDTSGVRSDFVGYDEEAPVLFRRKNSYYFLSGPLCADCPEGSDVFVEIAPSPFGPYHLAGNINHNSATSGATKGFLISDGFSHSLVQKNPLIHGQESWVARIPTAGVPMFIWMADNWKSAADGTRGHDFQYWSDPLAFNPDGTIQPLKYAPYWTITWTNEN